MKGKSWTREEDEICCKAVVDEYVIGKKHIDVDDCVSRICSCKGIEHEKNIVRMRLQNIKALLDEMGIPNTLDVKPLSHAGRQTRACLMSCLEKCGIKY